MKKQAMILQNLTRFEHMPDQFAKDGGSSEYVRRETQSVADLYSRLTRIRQAIQSANNANVLTVEGRKAEKQQREFLYQGISSRPFRRQFNLADYVQVKGAALDNGLLQIELVREIPEAMKPRRIAIAGAPASNLQQIETKAA